MKKKVIGYVSLKDIAFLGEEDVKRLDVINLAFGHIREGRIVCPLEEVYENLLKVREINPELKVVLSIGGWSADGFSQAASTEEGRRLFAKTGAELAEKFGLDGIDIDWEYPCISIAGIAASPEDKDNFTLLLKAVREELDKFDRPMLVTIAGGGDGYYTRCTRLDEAVQYLDYVQIMSYDLRGGFQVETGHHTNLYANAGALSEASTEKGVKEYLAAGVPAEKLIIGAAYYSRMWTGVPDVNHGLIQMAASTGGYGPGYGELAESYVDKNGYQRFWDDEAKAPYLFNGDTFISYEDEESLAWKAAFVKERGLGGIMFWEYGLDTTKTLTKCIAEHLKEGE